MTIETIINFPVNSNCYVLYPEIGKNCIIIDPGTENCNELIEFLTKKSLTPTFVILTHEHFDHVWGVNKLSALFSANVICSVKCLNLIGDKKRNLSIFYDNKGFEVTLKRPVIFSEEIKFEKEIILKLFETPGHSPGSISVLIGNDLFVGDLILIDNATVTKLPGGSKKQLKESIIKLHNLFQHKPIRVYPGHGKSFEFNDVAINVIS